MARLSSRLKGIGSAIGRRLRPLRYALEDLLFVLGRVPRAIGRWCGVLARPLGEDFAAASCLRCSGVSQSRASSSSRSRRCHARCPAAIAARQTTTSPSWSPPTRSPTHTSTSTPTLTSTRRRQAWPSGFPVDGAGHRPAARQLPGPRGAPPEFADDVEPWFGARPRSSSSPRVATPSRCSCSRSPIPTVPASTSRRSHPVRPRRRSTGGSRSASTTAVWRRRLSASSS